MNDPSPAPSTGPSTGPGTGPSRTAEVRVISIGALAAHPLWNEKGDVRAGHATTTLVRAGDAVILVDPSLPPKVIKARLAERSALAPADVTHVFLTCLNPLHRRGLQAFDGAQWLVAEAEREAIGVGLVERMHEAHASGDDDLVAMIGAEIALLQRCVAAPDQLAPGVDLFPVHGVTPGLTGLLVANPNSTTVICGDAIATAEHLEAGRIHTPAHNVEQAGESFREVIEIADLIVPGRDNVLLNPLRRY